MAAVAAVALTVAARGQAGPPTDAQRVHRLATEIRCPTCRGLSAAESDAPPAQAIRDELLRRVQAGQTDSQILGYVVSRYGNDILLKPQSTGVAGLVWALPVVVAACAVGGFAAVFWRRRRPAAPRRASEEDEAIVEKALQS
jgi:cytochrome c-type biogenesis protein CcmH